MQRITRSQGITKEQKEASSQKIIHVYLNSQTGGD